MSILAIAPETMTHLLALDLIKRASAAKWLTDKKEEKSIKDTKTVIWQNEKYSIQTLRFQYYFRAVISNN